MKICAFETSCDDTAVAVVENGVKVLSNVCLSQVEHAKWGGVVPELAAREHAENWQAVLDEALKSAGLVFEKIDALAVTKGPGLSPALLSGTTAASFLALFENKKLIPVHHVFAHACAVFCERDLKVVRFPALVMTASGGHTALNLWRDYTDIQPLGKTRDDAAGEVFDKVAKKLGLKYPGGPKISRCAKDGDETTFKLPRIFLEKDSIDFSFSGLKSATFRAIEGLGNLSKQDIANVCASFEKAVADTFIEKIARAAKQFPEVKDIVFVGGVSANLKLRAELKDFTENSGRRLVVPIKPNYSTDNAAMVASAAYLLYQKNPEIAQVQFVDADARMVIND